MHIHAHMSQTVHAYICTCVWVYIGAQFRMGEKITKVLVEGETVRVDLDSGNVCMCMYTCVCVLCVYLLCVYLF